MYISQIKAKLLTWLVPLFFITSTGVSAAGLLTPKGANDSLELKEHHVEAVIENGFSTTSVTQIFSNPHTVDKEAIYSFPVPKDAAVGDFSIWIDGSPVTGEVVEKKKAREIYEQEKAQGNQVGLTEKNDFKTFEVSVYPVKANDDTKIQIRYFQKLEIDLNVGRWVYPLEDGGVDEQALAFWDTNTKVSKAFSFNFLLRSGYPVEAVRLPGHSQAKVEKLNDNEWRVSIVKNGNTVPSSQPLNDETSESLQQTYLKSNPNQATQRQIEVLAEEGSTTTRTAISSSKQSVFDIDKDLVVYWKLKEGLPGSVDLVTYRPDPTGKGTFMMTFTPGDDLETTQQGADWNFVLDISGSMQGKFSSLIEAVSRSIEKMRPNDRFRIILFNNSATELTNGYVNATPEAIQHQLSQLSQLRPDGGTNLYAGLSLGIDVLDSDRASAVILVTDGVANVGTTEKKAFFKLLEKRDVRLMTFVMGNSANEPLLEPLARRSGGFSMNVSNADDIIGRVLLASQRLSHKAFHDIEVKIDGIKVTDLSPADYGSLYRGQQLIVMGNYWQHGDAKVTLEAKLSGQSKRYSTVLNFPEVSTDSPELERLSAFGQIKDLSERMEDFAGEDHKQAITQIALEYGLVTDFTSMLVLNEAQYQSYNIKRNNKQRVEREAAARQQRAAQPVRSQRADKSQPAFKRSRPSFGGGSFGWGLGLLALLVVFTHQKKR